MEYVETVIIGGGQAGLSTSYYLSQDGKEHLILEQAENPANVWRNERWDSFTLVTPNWAFRIPGAKMDGEPRDGFLPCKRVVEFYDNYVKENKLPIKCSTKVSSIESTDNGFVVHASKDNYKAKNVIIATGRFQQPAIPEFASKFSPEIVQLPSTKYRNPNMLPPGGVLVVGSAQSGSQIAEELYKSGRKVYLSTGTAGRLPRKYRGKDIIEWLEMIGFFHLTPEQLPPGMGRFDGIPHLSGTNGGHTINIHQFAKDGVRVLGHLTGAENQKAFIAPDLYDNLHKVDELEIKVCGILDGYIQENGIDAPPAENLSNLKDGYEQPVIETLDLKKEGINTIIWAKGFRFNYSLANFPVYDSEGYPVQNMGVTNVPGLYFVGLPWMPSERSGFLIGVAENAKYIASNIISQKGKRQNAMS